MSPLPPLARIALAHWAPDEPRYRPTGYGAPTLGSVRACLSRDLLVRDPTAPRAAYGDVPRLMLSQRGAAHLADLYALEVIVLPAGCVRLHGDHYREDCAPGCYLRVAGYDTGPGIYEYRAALAWAPEVAA